MAVYSVNQATQMYVGATKGTSGDHVYYTVDGVRSDLINKNKVLAETKKTVTELATAYKVFTPTITVGTPVLGHQYLVRLIVTTDAGTANAEIKSVGVICTNSADTLASDIASALTKSASRDLEPLYTAAAASGVVTITPKVYHTVGKRLVVPAITVEVADLTEPDNTMTINGKGGWVNNGAKAANVSSKTYSAIALEIVKAQLKDLEYFCAGEKGDIYRGTAYPNDIPFESKLGSIADTWSVRTIHYYDDCSNEAVQKSEKTIVLIGSTDPGAAKA